MRFHFLQDQRETSILIQLIRMDVFHFFNRCSFSCFGSHVFFVPEGSSQNRWTWIFRKHKNWINLFIFVLCAWVVWFNLFRFPLVPVLTCFSSLNVQLIRSFLQRVSEKFGHVPIWFLCFPNFFFPQFSNPISKDYSS